ncbi:MAG: HNH endonuclease [Parcubacteria group bacterium GW2011_GWA2_47_21]|nr:MAG: HNH endonuclease [Parcubacteria group bacterium GW2011_GWA2_47_21]
MTVLSCDSCHCYFSRKPSQIGLAKRHFCSTYCQYKASRKGSFVRCLQCSKKVYKSLNNLKRSKSKKHFCSVLCSNIWHGKEFSREKHPNWKGGEFSYKDALKRHDVLKQCVLCGKSDQRILAVHHVDRNRKNNKLENLMWLCHNCHFLVHHYKREGLKIMKS